MTAVATRFHAAAPAISLASRVAQVPGALVRYAAGTRTGQVLTSATQRAVATGNRPLQSFFQPVPAAAAGTTDVAPTAITVDAATARAGEAAPTVSAGAARGPAPTSTPETAPPRATVSPAMREKILYGERNVVTNPMNGNVTVKMKGGHSANLLEHPDYATQVVRQNPAQGTVTVEYVKWHDDLGVVSNIKSPPSTIRVGWTDEKVIEVTEHVANLPEVAVGQNTGSTLHRAVVEGTEWEVIRNARGKSPRLTRLALLRSRPTSSDWKECLP